MVSWAISQRCNFLQLLLFLVLCYQRVTSQGYTSTSAGELLRDGDVRLVDGSGPSEGRVEVYRAGSWGTVCDVGWDLAAATVVCQQVGYFNVMIVRVDGFFGGTILPHLLVDVSCVGTEDNLLQCTLSDAESDGECTHHDTAGVVCSNEATVRLVEGSLHREGRVEIFARYAWYTICGDSFNRDGARVICRQLGYYDVEDVFPDAFFGAGISYQPTLVTMDCTGQEVGWADCHTVGYDTSLCSHRQDVGVRCTDAPIAEGSVRLADGQAGTEGRVEIFLSGQWGTVCDDLWDIEDAKVVCRQLGYSSAVSSTSSAGPGSEYIPIFLDDVDCLGEQRLSDCSASSDYPNCEHSEDAGVECSVDEYFPFTPRLANGPTSHEGRVEIWTGSQWEVVCHDLSSKTISVICWQLHHLSTFTRYPFNKYGVGKERLSNYTFDCDEEEMELGLYDCGVRNDTAVFHATPETCNTVAVNCDPATAPIGVVIGIIIFVLLILLCCCGCCCWRCKSEKKETTAVPPAQTTLTQSVPLVHPPPTGAPAAAPASHEMDQLPSYKDVVTDPQAYPPTGGYPTQQPYPQQQPYHQQQHPYPEQRPYPPQPYPPNSQAATYPPQPVQPYPAYPSSPGQPPLQGDSKAYPQQPTAAPYPGQPSVAPYPPEHSANPYSPPNPSTAPYPPNPPVSSYPPLAPATPHPPEPSVTPNQPTSAID